VFLFSSDNGTDLMNDCFNRSIDKFKLMVATIGLKKPKKCSEKKFTDDVNTSQDNVIRGFKEERNLEEKVNSELAVKTKLKRKRDVVVARKETLKSLLAAKSRRFNHDDDDDNHIFRSESKILRIGTVNVSLRIKTIYNFIVFCFYSYHKVSINFARSV
jgi:hypothetical protein